MVFKLWEIFIMKDRSIVLCKNTYLKLPIVSELIDYLEKHIDGATFQHKITIRDKRLSKNDPRRINPEFLIYSLESAFEGYWWDGEGFDVNNKKLNQVQDEIRDALKNSISDESNDKLYISLCKVLSWGAGGTRTSLYTSNRDWAFNYKRNLRESLNLGCEAMRSNTPDLSVFNHNPNKIYARMNAGFTKFYSLACDNVVIYDGRVGSALGFMVRLFCQNQKLNSVPPEIAFRWGAQTGSNPLNRDPSLGQFNFAKLPVQGSIWAEWNIKANWILSAASARSKATWCSGENKLRRLEAALFVMGYSMTA